MNDESQIGLVEAHAQGRGGHERLDPVGLEGVLEPLPLGRVGPTGVGGRLQPRLAEALGDLHGRRDRQAVHDARAGCAAQIGGQPRQARCGIGQAAHAQVEGVPLQGPPQDEDPLGPAPRRGTGELLGDVRGDAGIGGRRGGQDRRARGQARQQGADAPVVGAEVVAPVRDAVRLVDDDQAGVGCEGREDLLPESRIVEPLGGHQQDVDGALAHPGLDVRPLRGVGGVHGDGVDAGAPGRRDLVAHEGEQGRDDHRRPRRGAVHRRGRGSG